MVIPSQLCIQGLGTMGKGERYNKLERAGNQFSVCADLTLEGWEGYLGRELEVNFSLIRQAFLYLGPSLSQGAATGRSR